MGSAGFDEIADLALRKSGQNFRRSQHYLVEARLAHILRRESFASLNELAECLQARPNQAFEDEIVAALTSKTAVFFQDREALGHIVKTLLPRASAARADGEREPLRVLCAGGGTGQEAYSLAILLDEAERLGAAALDVDIISIDLCRATTERARKGLFGHFEIQMGMSAQRMLKHFHREDAHWKVSDEIARRVRFEVANLMDPFDRDDAFDVVLCRNVMIHMAGPIAQDLADRLSTLLLPTGLLFLGQGEQLAGGVKTLRPSYDARGAWCLARGEDEGEHEAVA